jgi:hypothetical protein
MINGRTYLTLDITKNDRVFVFSIPYGSLYDEAFQALEEFKAGVQEMAKAADEAAKKAAEENKTDVVPEIVDLT